MKKRHYIQLAILLVIALIYVSLKTGTVRFERIPLPTEGVMTLQVVDNTSGVTNEATTLSVHEREIEINRSDYKTDSDYRQAISEAKEKLGFRKKKAEPIN